jgi:type I restriction enzyme S subunit
MELKKYNNILKINQIVHSVSETHRFDKDKLIAINTSDVENGMMNGGTLTPVEELKGQFKKTIMKGDILFSEIRPANRRFAKVTIEDCDNFVVSTKLMVLRKYNKDVDLEYFYYCLTNQHFLNILQRRAENRIGSFPQITFDLLSEYAFPIPPISEQKRISKVISTLDKKIAINRAINQNLEAMAKQLYHYWFVQFDFPNEEGKPYKSSGGEMVWNDKLKREIPKGWDEGILIDIANITMGQSPDGSSYNEVGDGMLFYQGSTDFGIRFPSVRQYTTAPSRFAKKGDILMSVRAPVGSINIANKDCCIGRGLSAINSKLGSMTHLYYILNDLRIAFEQRNAAGTTFGSITKEDLYSLPIIIPSDEVIRAFNKICSPIFDRQMILGEEINTLTKQRDELLPLLMNGQVSVNSDLSVH